MNDLLSSLLKEGGDFDSPASTVSAMVEAAPYTHAGLLDQFEAGRRHWQSRQKFAELYDRLEAQKEQRLRTLKEDEEELRDTHKPRDQAEREHATKRRGTRRRRLPLSLPTTEVLDPLSEDDGEQAGDLDHAGDAAEEAETDARAERGQTNPRRRKRPD